MRRALATVIAAVTLAAALPHSAGADPGAIGWDGKNPFACTLQQLGEGTNFPEPNADPFCVEYDKRHQNVDKLGVVAFLSEEPARFAAASSKCFYFQHDHWVGSVVQGNGETQTYAWDGSYYFDKSKGTGGAYVENFSINGHTGDPTQVPGFPSDYKPFFGNGRGGVQAENNVPADPSCVAKAKAHSPYAGPGAGLQGADRCRVPGGRVNRGIGGIRLRARRAKVRSKLGSPTKESLRFVDYCLVGGGRLVGAFNGASPGGRVVLVLTDSRQFDMRGIRPGQALGKVHRKLRRFHKLRRKVHRVRVRVSRRKHQLLIAGTLNGRIAYVAVAKRNVSRKRVRRLLRAMPS